MDFVGLVEILYHWIRSKPSFQMNKLIRTNAPNKWIFLDNVIKSNRLWVVFGAAGSISASQASLGLKWIQCFVLVFAVIVFQFFSFVDWMHVCVAFYFQRCRCSRAFAIYVTIQVQTTFGSNQGFLRNMFMMSRNNSGFSNWSISSMEFSDEKKRNSSNFIMRWAIFDKLSG